MHLHTCIYERTHMMISVKAWVRRAVSNFCVPTVRAWPSWNFQNLCSWTPMQVRQEPGAVIPCKSCKRMCCCKSILTILKTLPFFLEISWSGTRILSTATFSTLTVELVPLAICWSIAVAFVHLQWKAQIPRACLPVLSFSKQDFATSARVQVQLWTKNSDPFYFLAWFQHTFVWFYLAAYVFRFQIIESDCMWAKIMFDFMMPRRGSRNGWQMHQAAPPVFQRLSQKCVERLRLASC